MPGTTISSSAVNSDLSDVATALTGSVAADGQTPMSGSLKGTDATANDPMFRFSSDNTGFFLNALGQIGISLSGVLSFLLDTSGISTPGGVLLGTPVGTINDYAGSTAPSGWLLCYGQDISRTTYSALFTVIGTTYGAGDASTTFALPDCRGRLSAGKDNMGGTAASRITTAGCGIDGVTLGAAGGEQTHLLTQAELSSKIGTATSAVRDPTHQHDLTFSVGTPGASGVRPGPGGAVVNTVSFSAGADAKGANTSVKTVIQNQLLVSTVLTTVNGSASATVASATGLVTGMAIDAVGVSSGTTISAIAGTTITMSAAATTSCGSTNQALTTTNGSQTATVNDAAGIRVGMEVVSANVPSGTVIMAINGTTFTLSAPATGGGTNAATYQNTANFTKNTGDTAHNNTQPTIMFNKIIFAGV